jgi:hypothetical protein
MRFRFSIRDLLWLTALVAMAAGWWLDHRRVQTQNAEIQAKYKQLEIKLSIIEDGLIELKELGGGEFTVRYPKK